MSESGNRGISTCPFKYFRKYRLGRDITSTHWNNILRNSRVDYLLEVTIFARASSVSPIFGTDDPAMNFLFVSLVEELLISAYSL
jgi:hypothetical protein